MQGLCAEKKAIGPRKQRDCSTLQSIADKESANREQARVKAIPLAQFSGYGTHGAPTAHLV